MNYSKWDNLEVSDDEEDEKPTPRVTKLDNPSSITFGGKKTGINGQAPIEVNSTNKPMEILPKPPSNNKNKQIKVTSLISSSSTKKPTTVVKGSLSESYSKWDNFNMSDDDEENDEEYDENDDNYEVDDDENEELEQMKLQNEIGLPSPEPKSVPSLTPKIDIKIDLNNDLLSRNGSKLLYEKYNYIWGQTRKEVLLYIVIPFNTKGKDIHIEAKKWNLLISIQKSNKEENEILLNNRLAYPIDVPDEELPDAVASEGNGKIVELDWEIKNGIHSQYQSNQNQELRILCLTLIKKAPAPDVIVWWQNVFTDHKGGQISIEDMPDRATASQSVFQKNWNEAHIKFREKVSKIEKVVVDTSESAAVPKHEIQTSPKMSDDKVVEIGSDHTFDLDASN